MKHLEEEPQDGFQIVCKSKGKIIKKKIPIKRTYATRNGTGNPKFQMKILYWNIRGIANSPSRLVLKRLILANKPDFVFIYEPWMPFHIFPISWLID
jgi:hypothetical protein